MRGEIPPLVWRVWREGDGWHADLAAVDGTPLDDPVESPFESKGAARTAIRKMVAAVKAASIVVVDGRPEDARD